MATTPAISLDDRSFRRVMDALRGTLRAANSKTTLLRVGSAAIAVIKDRTQERHQSATERQLLPYSKSYARRKGVGRQEVSLTDTGQMFDALERKVSKRDTVLLSFQGTRANWLAETHHLGLRGQKKRPFFDIGRTRDEKLLFDVIISRAVRMQAIRFKKDLQ